MKFLNGPRKNKKEAAKILEYVTTVERMMQTAEILQALESSNIDRRKKLLREAGLKEVIFSALFSCSDQTNEWLLQVRRAQIFRSRCCCTVSILLPLNDTAPQSRVGKTSQHHFHPSELVVAIIDSSPLSQLLTALDKVPRVIPLRGTGMVREEVSVQPVLFQLAIKALNEVRDHILPAPAYASATESPIEDTASSMGGGTSTHSAMEPMLSRDAHNATSTNSSTVRSTVSLSGEALPLRIRLIGHSAGAGVAAIMSVILDGTLNPSLPQAELERLSPFIGLYANGMVRCYAMAPPPTIGRAIVPRGVSSLICGDDVIPRSAPAALSRFRDRVTQAVLAKRKRSGFLAPLDWVHVQDWVRDVSAVAGTNCDGFLFIRVTQPAPILFVP